MLHPAGDLTTIFLPVIEDELHHAVEQAMYPIDNQLHQMLAYHMGWLDKDTRTETKGKRFRPLLVLLTCVAAGGDWNKAIPAAAAVELVHNFSLIHDDIEDHSPLRRGRPTIWKKQGIPQAINAGDAMFTLAYLESLHLAETIPLSSAITAFKILQQACLHLTQGQYLDLAFEKQVNVSLENYWHMVEGKTAALISASTEIGSITAMCDENTRRAYRDFGRLLGLAFQARDDYLGTWGKTGDIGKSTLSDITTKKITLPVLYGLSRNGKFAQRWRSGPIHPEQTDEVILLLENDGGKEFTRTQTTELIQKAITALEKAHPDGESAEALKNLALSLTISTD